MTAVAQPVARPALPVVLWESVRPRSLTVAVVSSIVGTLSLLPRQRPVPLIALLCLVLAVLLQCATNVLNDAEDALTGADAFAGAGSSVAMQRGWIDSRGARTIALACFALAAIDGALIVLFTQKPGLLLLGAAGAAVGWAYTAPPLRLAYRPLGELASGVPMGIGIVWGSAAAQSNAVPAATWWAAVPLALLTAAILHGNNARDREHDTGVGKRTLATYLSPSAVALEYQLLIGAVTVVVAAGIALRALPLWCVIAFVPSLLAFRTALRANASLDPRGWTRLLIAAVRAHQRTAFALCAGFLLSLIG